MSMAVHQHNPGTLRMSGHFSGVGNYQTTGVASCDNTSIQPNDVVQVKRFPLLILSIAKANI